MHIQLKMKLLLLWLAKLASLAAEETSVKHVFGSNNAPDLFDTCETICRRPFVCKASTNSTKKTCYCEKPYKLVGTFCLLDCKIGENYDVLEVKCVPKCKATEIKIDSKCIAQAAIGSPCEIDLQCNTGYSECEAKKCVCRSGFTAIAGTCVADSASCPYGDPLNGDGGKSFQTCFVFQTPSGMNDTCPHNYFCQITGGPHLIASGSSHIPNSDGICCPKLNATCPLGAASSKYSCQYSPTVQMCPVETHYCYDLSIGPMSNTQLCCPKKCPYERPLSVKGKCLPHVFLDGNCLTNEQCAQGNADCVNGVCKCSMGFKEVGSGGNKFCN